MRAFGTSYSRLTVPLSAGLYHYTIYCLCGFLCDVKKKWRKCIQCSSLITAFLCIENWNFWKFYRKMPLRMAKSFWKKMNRKKIRLIADICLSSKYDVNHDYSCVCAIFLRLNAIHRFHFFLYRSIHYTYMYFLLFSRF